MANKRFTKHKWAGRSDLEDGHEGLRVHQVIKAFTPNIVQPGVTLVGLASDLGVEYNQGRLGARNGPKHFRNAMANLAWHFDQPIFDMDDHHIDSLAAEPLARAQQEYASSVAQALAAKQFVFGIGGGHEIGWASYLGCRSFLDSINETSKSVAIINFDAHFDLRRPAPNASWAGSSGTPFYQVAKDCEARGLNFQYACLGVSQSANTKALFDYANDKYVSYLLDTNCNQENSTALIDDFLNTADYLYVTLCLDALPASIAPGVSAPSALGIELSFIINALCEIKRVCDAKNITWLMADIAELNPEYDIDQRTARVAARLAYEIIRLNE